MDKINARIAKVAQMLVTHEDAILPSFIHPKNLKPSDSVLMEVLKEPPYFIRANRELIKEPRSVRLKSSKGHYPAALFPADDLDQLLFRRMPRFNPEHFPLHLLGNTPSALLFYAKGTLHFISIHPNFQGPYTENKFTSLSVLQKGYFLEQTISSEELRALLTKQHVIALPARAPIKEIYGKAFKSITTTLALPEEAVLLNVDPYTTLSSDSSCIPPQPRERPNQDSPDL